MLTETYLGLKTTLQEVLNLEAEDVIKLHLGLVQDADPDQTPEERVTLEQPLGVLLLEGEEDSGGGPHLGQGVFHPPDLPLVPQPVLSNELQLLVETSLLEGPPGGRVGLGVDLWDAAVNHLGKRLDSGKGNTISFFDKICVHKSLNHLNPEDTLYFLWLKLIEVVLNLRSCGVV